MTPDSQKPTASDGPAADVVDVSVLVAVRNEEQFIRETTDAMREQQFDGRLEFLFIDGHSDDRTPEILEELATEDPRIRLFENPKRGVRSGLNVGLQHARGQFVVQMEGHTYYPATYIGAAIERLRRGDVDYVSGSPSPIGVDRWSRIVTLALNSWLGRGASRKWSSDDTGEAAAKELSESELDTGVFCGAWRRSTLEAYGGWDEDWAVNGDSELAARILEGGGKIVSLPELSAQYVPRRSLSALARQYFRYGLYREKTARRHSGSMRPSLLLPPGLALALPVAILSPQPLRALARLGLLSYLALTVVTAVRSEAERLADMATLPLVFATMHFCWGFGFLAGCLRFGPPLAALARLARRR
jgi:succinoglycan biosynthesis protein ExoA